MLIRKQQLFVKETSESFKYDLRTQTLKQVWKIAKDILGDEMGIQENFYALYYDNSMRVIGFAHISKGDITGTVVPMGVLFKYAIDLLATGIITFHNHPTGNLIPSEADKRISKQIVNAGRLINIKSIDNIIVTNEGCYSILNDCKQVYNRHEEEVNV